MDQKNSKKNKKIAIIKNRRKKKFFSFCFLKSQNKRVEPKKRRVVLQRDVNKLDQFLESQKGTKRNKAVLGRKFLVLKAASKFKDFVLSGISFLLKATKLLVYNSTLLTFLIAVIFLVSPLSSAAPQSKMISSQSDWESGEISNISTTSELDSMQLKSDGTWVARSWAPADDTIAYGSTSVIVGNYLYVVRGYSDNDVYVYNIELNEWEDPIDMPKPAFYGADVAYNGVDKLYFIFGGYSKKFYSYDIEAKTWEELPDLLDTVYMGASIEFDGTDFYINRGQASTDFWKFDVSENSWYNLAPAPSTIYRGGNMVYGENGKIYVLRGYNRNTFWEYDIATNTWSTLTSAPTTFYGEQKGVYRDGYIYFLRSYNTTGFYRYSIAGNSWEALPTTPLITDYSSISYDADDDKLFVIRADGSYNFWKYDPTVGSAGDWIGPENVPGTVNNGGDLIWNGVTGVGNYVYAVQGDGRTGFYRYDVTNNSWDTMSSLPATMGYDTKGTYYNGYIYIARGDNTAGNFYRYDVAGDSWSTMADPPGTLRYGCAATYNASDGYIYMSRGNAQDDLYRYDIAGDSWSTMAEIVADGVRYYPYYGGRMISDGTDLYLVLGEGETAFLKYSTASNTWSKLTPTPFAQYYGTDITYDGSGKILAFAGNYKDETWEYDIAANSWRELPANQKYSFGRGTWTGASIEYAGNDSFYATPGNDLTDFWSYTAGTNNFVSSGSFVSNTIDLGYVDSWLSLTANEDVPANTSISYQTRTSDDGTSWSVWEALSGTDIQSPRRRYIQIKALLATSDGVSTPTIEDITVSYNSEDVDPINPVTVTASSAKVGGEVLISGTAYKHAHPYFNWIAGTDAGSSIAGYYVYFGTDINADPETEGSFQPSTGFLANTAMTTGNYYLRIKTKDNDGNITDDAWNAFTYNYEGVSPFQSSVITTQAEFENGTTEDVSTSSEPDELQIEGVDGFWQQTTLSNTPGSMRYGAELAHQDGKLYALRGNNQRSFYVYDISLDTWTSLADTPESVYYGGALIEGPDGFLYAARGYNTPTFWRYDIVNDIWESVSSAPKNFYYGSSLSSKGGRYVYAFPGNDDVFYRYDTQENRWTTLSNAEFGNPNESDGQRAYRGSDSVSDGDNAIYAIQGNYYPYFTKYTIEEDQDAGEEEDTWEPLAQSPIGIYTGGCIAYDDEEESIFVLTGNYRRNFLRYDVTTNAWVQLPDIPVNPEYGASLKVVDGYVYAIRGSSSTLFYRFNIEENSWEIPQRGFFGPVINGGGSYFDYYYGAEMEEDHSGNVYIMRGDRSDDFGRYDISSGEFTKLSPVPVGVWYGSSMVFNEDENTIYASIGSGIRTRDISGESNYFLKYSIDSNRWEFITTDLIPDQTSYGSSMVYDGSRYIYLTEGSNTDDWWSYDTQAVAGSRWSSNLSVTTNLRQYYGGETIYKEVGGTPYLYWTRGGSNPYFFRHNLSDSSWTQLPNVPGNVHYGGSLVDGRDGYLYAARGANTKEFYRYDIDGNSWETLDDVPAQVYTGGAATFAENRVWMVTRGSGSYTDGLYSYVVSSPENNVGFEKTGSYTSESIDLIDVYRWANLTLNYETPENTSVAIYTQTSSDDSEWSNWEQVTNRQALGTKENVFDILSSVNRYIKVRVEFTSADRIKSPLVEDITINYYQDSAAPTNPSAITAFDTDAKVTSLTDNTWYGHTAPHFEWPVAEQVGGASDGVGGSGVVGYYVYFGDNASADPYLDGTLQATNEYTATGLVSGQDYYLRIKAIDDAEMIPASTYAAFTYRFDSTPPENPTSILVNPAGYTATDNYVFTWEADSTDVNSGVVKFQYQTAGDDPATWVDINDPAAITLTLPNVDHPVGAYQSGKNWFHLRVVDAAGNVSDALKQEYYFSASAPSPPRDLIVTPPTSTTNSFAFEWNGPESYMGDPDKIQYLYSVNALPSAYNTTQTAVKAAGPGPFATQKGANRFYVCAMDEAENVDYDLYAYVDFIADTTAPGAPVNLQIFDTSDRENQEYSIAVKWSPPVAMNEDNFAGYIIYRSDDGTNFTEVASTSGSAYVDTELSSRLYYYQVKSKDSTNNLSVASTIVSIIPTGRYTTPPKLVTEPSHTVQAHQAEIKWGTNRVASSFVEYGKSMSLGKTNGQVDSVTDHIVELSGLDAGTKYYYKAKYIDPDGNIGTSEIFNFETLPPPTISEVESSDIGLEVATISWETNTSASCTLKYGKGSSLTDTIEESSSGGGHLMRLEGLESTTDYGFQIDCIDDDLNEFSSDRYNFRTLEQPISSELVVENKENVDLPTIIVKYNTTLPTTTLVKFKGSSEGETHNYLDNAFVTEHVVEIEGLIPSIEYQINVGGVAEDGVSATTLDASVLTRADSRPPGILSNRAVGRVIGRGKDARANLYIKVETDELTTAKVFYSPGIVLSNFEQSSSEDPLNTYHLVTIPVEPGQVYSYIVKTHDESGNETSTKAVTVVVEDSKENATEIVVGTFSDKFSWISTLWE